MRNLALLAVLFLMVAPAFGSVVTLGFVGLQNLEPIDNYYDGGYGGFGSGPGPNYGITFGSDSLAIISEADGGTGNFQGAPTDTVAFFLSGPGDIMNVSSGFTTGFSFFYSAILYGGTVNVYSGLNDTGTLLASLSLPTTPSEPGTSGCPGGEQYCPWVPTGVTFSGVAESVNFGGTANYIGFDDITLGSSTPGVPEPSMMVVLAGAMGILAFRRFRRAN
jgi:hypothetical protein